ncbi:MAG: GspH/FimT family pseudopilin [Xanthomonadales bacterium]|nr:GspH/FimT family pseudopilin [Xanthomonadales bacterium]
MTRKIPINMAASPVGAKGRQQGLSAIELMILIAVAGLIFLVSVPGSSWLLERSRINSASENLLTALNIAQQEAQARNSTVRVCPSSNGRTCRRDNNWALGWLVFSDGNADGEVQEIELLEVFEAPHQPIEIIASGGVRAVVSFTVAGLADSENARDGQFVLCYPGSRLRARTVVVNADGWVYLKPENSPACESA